MNIRLIAIDLDGTALQNDHCSFSPRLLSALGKARDKGIAIVPVTGRQYKLLPPPVQGWTGLGVLCNGGQICRLETGERLQSLELSKSALEQLIALAETFDIPLEFSRDSKLHLTRRSLEQQQDVASLRFHREVILAKNGVILESLVPLCGPGVEKAQLPHIPEPLQEEVEAALRHIDASAVRSSPTGMEITHPLATKGNALERVCALLDVPPESVLALGDSGNDISMLQTAGLGIAMGNAPDFVKAAADAVTDTNDADGAAKAIETWALL